MMNRLWVQPVTASSWKGRIGFLRFAWHAFLHPAPRIPGYVRGKIFMEAKGDTVKDVWDIAVMGMGHLVRGETTLVLNHGLWVPGATAVRVMDDPRGNYMVTLPGSDGGR